MEDHVQDYVLQNMRRYHDLRARSDAGQLSQQQFIVEIQKLRWQDSHKVWWTIDPAGALLRYDGQRWVADQPAACPPSPPPTVPVDVPVSTPAQMVSAGLRPAPVTTSASVPTPAKVLSPSPMPPPGQETTNGRSPLKLAAPVLVLIPSLLCGSLWFLYTFIGVFKYEGIRGIDCLTPLIVGGLPVLFWLLKKPLDRLLMPLKPVIQAVPKPLRLGVCLAIPVFLGCGCSMLSPSGYLALSVSALVSVVTAGLLMRY